MGANNPYFPSLAKVNTMEAFTQIMVDETKTGLPLRIRVDEFFQKAVTLNLLSTLSFTALADTPNALGTAGQILQMNSGADALEFVNNTFLLNSDTPASMGTAGQILQVNSGATALEFVNPSTLTFGDETNDFTADNSTVGIYRVDTSSNDVDVDLDPATLVVGKPFYIIKTSGSNTMSLTPASGTINGQATIPYTAQWSSVLVVCDGTNFYIL